MLSEYQSELMISNEWWEVNYRRISIIYEQLAKDMKLFEVQKFKLDFFLSKHKTNFKKKLWEYSATDRGKILILTEHALLKWWDFETQEKLIKLMTAVRNPRK